MYSCNCLRSTDPYSPTNLKSIVSLILQNSLNLKVTQITSDWQNCLIKQIRNFVTYKFRKS